MPVELAHYGLEANPFKREELDPLHRPTDSQILARINGFRQLDEVESYLERQVAAGEPAFLLVTGRSGCGRTSVANHILAHYRQLRGITPDRFVIPERRVENHDEYSILKQWMIYLYDEIDSKRIDLANPDLERDLISIPNTVGRETMRPTLRMLARRVSQRLSSLDAAFGVCLENVDEYTIISSAMAIFERSETVCVFTALDYEESRREVIQRFRQTTAAAPDRLVQLTPIGGQPVNAVVDLRWQHQTERPNPFDPTGIAHAFGTPRPIARVLSIMGGLLEMKLAGYSGDGWPDDPILAFDADEISQKVDIIGRYWR